MSKPKKEQEEEDKHKRKHKHKHKHKKSKRDEEYESTQKINNTSDGDLIKKKKRKQDRHRHHHDEQESNLDKARVKQDTIQIIISDKKSLNTESNQDVTLVGGRVVSSSAQEFQPIIVQAPDSISTIPTTNTAIDSTTHLTSSNQQHQPRDVTLLLFYQYIEPLWNEQEFQTVIQFVEDKGHQYSVTGRMRVAYEGLNCTLTGSFHNVRLWCRALRDYQQGKYFGSTEFKLTDDLPRGQAFPKLHVFKVDELVHYGLDGKNQHSIPSIHMTGVHLEPHQYHEKMNESDTVIIDVRNHYEATIGRFDPPPSGAVYVDPNMRKSTEFPSWLDKPSTKDLLRGKQVLMYCTGGRRYGYLPFQYICSSYHIHALLLVVLPFL